MGKRKAIIETFLGGLRRPVNHFRVTTPSGVVKWYLQDARCMPDEGWQYIGLEYGPGDGEDWEKDGADSCVHRCPRGKFFVVYGYCGIHHAVTDECCESENIQERWD